MRYLRGFARFWYDFVVGDDWKIAATVVAMLLVGVAVVASGVPAAVVTLLLGALLLLGFVVAVLLDVRPKA